MAGCKSTNLSARGHVCVVVIRHWPISISDLTLTASFVFVLLEDAQMANFKGRRKADAYREQSYQSLHKQISLCWTETQDWVCEVHSHREEWKLNCTISATKKQVILDLLSNLGSGHKSTVFAVLATGTPRCSQTSLENSSLQSVLGLSQGRTPLQGGLSNRCLNLLNWLLSMWRSNSLTQSSSGVLTPSFLPRPSGWARHQNSMPHKTTA